MDLTRILPLPPDVVDRIAAGEVIQRPSSAIKELIENSVDAGATQVTVTVKGSATLLQVQDNGHGIHPEDLLLICKRFNTSKLRAFDDLKSMQTYGFRGEALASMSHVARVTITTQRPDQPCSFRSTYKDGNIIGKPSKCAGVPGTTITIEDLFYNVPQRLRALKSAGEEYARVLDVVQKYAIHHSGKVGFTCKRAGQHSPDVHTSGTSSLRENIGKVFGSDLARELLDFTCSPSNAGEFESFKGIVTNPNYSRKKGEFLLFINGRLVDSAALKRVVDACYSDCLPKGGHPFVYLSLQIPLENVDVNVHPTKREVQFLHEDEICEALSRTLKSLLLGGNDSRTFQTAQLQTRSQRVASEDNKYNDNEDNSVGNKRSKHDDEIEVDEDEEDEDEETQLPPSVATKKRKVSKSARPDKLVRTDSHMGSGMERFVVSSVKKPKEEEEDRATCCSSEHHHHPHETKPLPVSPSAYIIKPDDLADAPLIVATSDALELQSVKSLLQQVVSRKSLTLTDCLSRSVFVGVVDDTFSLLQYDTSLVAVNHLRLARELFYQRALALFGRFRMISLKPPPVIHDLLEGDEPSVLQLASRAELLYEYFGVDVRGGKLKALPCLIAGHVPVLRSIPKLVRRLVKDVNWDDEVDCFRDIARELAMAYAEMPDFSPLITTIPNGSSLSIADRTSLQHLVKNVLFPAWKTQFLAPLEFFEAANGCVVPLAKLEQLYKIFERC